ncbi:uncharacterized protein LOC118767225 [Octopus sinensis]|uniref:Uncharacterized protein LOC118767225 n=1 Tax=Octopus sinensis TaxID=2607531 RepID=A0A7E6FI34_9MOLL|nr:uncharacterized protein LOC118767225 [Octopus sinensis]
MTVAAILYNTEEETNVLKVTRTTEVKWFGYSFEVTVQISLLDLHKIVDEIMLPKDVKLKVIVEGRSPICYHCEVQGHMQARCLQKQEVEQEEEVEQGVVARSQVSEEMENTQLVKERRKEMKMYIHHQKARKKSMQKGKEATIKSKSGIEMVETQKPGTSGEIRYGKREGVPKGKKTCG